MNSTFNQDNCSCTHPNVSGTKKELLEYFDREIIKERKLTLDKNLSLEKQLESISRSKFSQGTVYFMFEESDKNALVESQKIAISSRKRKK